MAAIGAVSEILPIIAGIGTAVKAVKTVTSLVEGNQADAQKQALANLKAQQAAQTAAAQAQVQASKDALTEQQNSAQSAADAAARRSALLRAVATQRAAYGSEGINSASGSPEAVLLGLYNNEDAAQAQADQIANLKDQALHLNADQQNSLNLLQATQLAQRAALSGN